MAFRSNQGNKSEFTPAWATSLLLLFLTLGLRVSALIDPIIDIDESMFAVYANVILHGGAPYLDSVDTKGPMIYYFYAAIFKLFGELNMIAVHAVTAIWVWATALILSKIVSRFTSAQTAFFSALFYILFTTTYTPKYISTSMVVVMMLPLSLAMLWTIRGKEKQTIAHLLASGVAVGIAFLTKYQAGIQLPILFATILILYTHQSIIKRTLNSLWILTGFGLTILLFIGWLHHIDAWSSFEQWSVLGSYRYILSQMPWSEKLTRMAIRLGGFTLASFPGWGLAIYAILRSKNLTNTRTAIMPITIIWLALSYIPVCTGWRFYPHYFVQLVPPMAILAAIGLDLLLTTKPERCRLITAAILFPVIVLFIVRTWIPDIHHRFGDEEMNDYRPAATYIQRHTSPDDTIFVWGFATPIYFFADRLPASRFLFCDWQTGRVPGTSAVRQAWIDTSNNITPQSWAYLMADLQQRQPLYIIDTSPANLHDYGKYPIQHYKELLHYLAEHYTIEATVNRSVMYRRNEAL